MTIKLWDLNNFNLNQTLLGHNGPVNSLSILNDNKYLASSSLDRSILIWDLQTCLIVRNLTGHSGDIMTLATSNGYLISGSDDKTIKIWSSFN